MKTDRDILMKSAIIINFRYRNVSVEFGLYASHAIDLLEEDNVVFERNRIRVHSAELGQDEIEAARVLDRLFEKHKAEIFARIAEILMQELEEDD